MSSFICPSRTHIKISFLVLLYHFLICFWYKNYFQLSLFHCLRHHRRARVHTIRLDESSGEVGSSERMVAWEAWKRSAKHAWFPRRLDNHLSDAPCTPSFSLDEVKSSRIEVAAYCSRRWLRYFERLVAGKREVRCCKPCRTAK